MRKPVDITRLKAGDKVIAVSTRHTENTPLVGLDDHGRMVGHAKRGAILTVENIRLADGTAHMKKLPGDDYAWTWNVNDLVYADDLRMPAKPQAVPTPGRWTTFLAEKYQEAA